MTEMVIIYSTFIIHANNRIPLSEILNYQILKYQGRKQTKFKYRNLKYKIRAHRKSEVSCGLIKISLAFFNLGAIFFLLCIILSIVSSSQTLRILHFIFCDWLVFK